MDSGIKEILGKTVCRVIVKRGRDPRSQVFLLFDTDPPTYYEFFSSADIEATSHAYEGDADRVRGYMSRNRIVLDVGVDRQADRKAPKDAKR